jgi:ethanolamine ammonia-lyase large subunit
MMGIPGSDDIMLNYQTTSFHDALYARRVLNLKPAPEFVAWLEKMEIFKNMDKFILNEKMPQTFFKSLSNVIGNR